MKKENPCFRSKHCSSFLKYFTNNVIFPVYKGILVFVLVVFSISFSWCKPAQNDTIVFGSDQFYPPFEYLNKKGEPVGFNIDLIRMVAQKMNTGLKIKLGNWEQIRRELEVNRTVDISDMYYSPSRDSFVDYAIPHEISFDEIYLHKEAKPIKKIEELTGKKVAVQKASTMEDYILSNYPGIKTIPTETEFEALKLVSDKKIDAAIVAQITGKLAIEKYNIKNIVSYGHLIFPRKFGFVVKEGNTELLEKIDVALAELINSGEVEKLRVKWFEEKIFGIRYKYIKAGITGLFLLLVMFLLRNYYLKLGIKKRNAQLHLSEEKYKAMVDAIPDLVFVCDKKGVFLDFHQPAGEKLMLPPDKFIGSNVADIMPPDVAVAAMEALNKCLVSQNKQSLEYNLEIEGENRSYSAVFMPLGPDKILIVVGNITEQKTASHKLLESQTRLNGVVQNASEGISITDEEGKIIVWNKALEEITGIDSSTTIGENIWDIQTKMNPVELQTDEFRKKYKEGILNFLKTGTSPFKGIALERKYIKPNGDEIFIKGVLNSIKSEKGFLLFSTTEDITNQKLTESELRRSEQEFREIYNSTSEAIFVHEALNGKILDCNNRALQMFGYSNKEEILQLNVGNLSVENGSFTNEKAVALIRKTMDEDEEQTFEWHAKKKNGEVFWLENTMKKTTIGEENRVLVVCRDISQRKLAEEALKRSEYLLNETQRLTKVGGWEYDVGSGETYLSDEVFNIYGITDKEMFAPENGVKFYHPDDRQLVIDSFSKAITNAEPYDLEVRFINAHGEHLFVRTAGKPILENGKVVKVIGNLIDITEHKKTEKSLQESEAKFRLAFKTSPDSININRLSDGMYVDINQGFTEVTGYTADEVIGKTSHEINIWENVFDRNKLVEGLKERGRVQNLEAKFRMKNGSIIDGLMSASVIGLNNEPHILSISRNITDRKKAQDAVKKTSQQLITTFESMADAFVSLDTEWNYTYMNKIAGVIFNRVPENMVGKNIWEEFPEGVGQPFHLAYEKAMKSQKPEYLIEYYPPYNKWFENRIYPSPSGLSIFFTDITEKKINEMELQRQTNELNSLYALSRETSITLSLDKVIRNAIKGLYKAVNPDLVFFFLRDGSKLVLKDFVPHVAGTRLGEIPEHKVGECMCGLAVTENRALYSNDIFNDLRCTWDECKKAGFHSFASLPVRKENEVIGVIGLASDKPRDFESQSEFLETLINSVSLYVQNAQLHEELQEHSVDLEQKVITRTRELEVKISEIERMNRLFVGRELRMKELKEKIKELKDKLK